MKTCPYCRKRIDAQAIKCPHCASGFDGSQMEVGLKEYSRERWGTLGLIVLAIVAIFWWLATPGTVESVGEWSAKNDQVVE